MEKLCTEIEEMVKYVKNTFQIDIAQLKVIK